MKIGFISHSSKKYLLETFCIAYKDVIAKHEIIAPEYTARIISEVTGCKIRKLIPESVGGDRQLREMIENGGVDIVFVFYTPSFTEINEVDNASIMRACALHNIPIAINLATSDTIMLALQRGDLDWLAHPSDTLQV